MQIMTYLEAPVWSLGNLKADSLLDKLWSGDLKKICSPLILSAKF